jgi:hypothetical protein
MRLKIGISVQLASCGSVRELACTGHAGHSLKKRQSRRKGAVVSRVKAVPLRGHALSKPMARERGWRTRCKRLGQPAALRNQRLQQPEKVLLLQF